MEQKTSSIKNILIGTGISAAAGATTGATLAILRNGPVKSYALATGVNCGIFGATFFIIRETFINYQRQQNPHYGLKDSQTRDIDALMSSTMAGITTGGLLSAVYRGPKGVVPGSVVFGLVCAGGQVVVSAANRWRQDTIVKERLMDLTPDQPIPTKKIWDYIEIPSWSPVRKISDDEYEQLLDDRLKELEQQVKQIEKEMAKTSKNTDASTSPSS
ncbi:hypothetical protein DM01DRAFT_1335320 [Hesseltinella vesiculosa]|uniref:Tim17-domain-containing protein n=1 Tax=Hesseltinella vesiculosa TaxID=101127 RepID=A0A1X2GJ13_9FUNG|nr:hypothetical protein DM01DRAFT_1335320 [Hesseltinella vesiculosa]